MKTLYLLPLLLLGACDKAEVKTPVPGNFGVDLSAMDQNVRPQDDFYRYVNGTWLKNTTIPDDKSNYGAFTALDDRAQEQVRSIIEEAAAKTDGGDEDQRKIGAFYAAFMDQERADKLGIEPVRPMLAAIAAAAAPADVTLMLAQNVMHGLTSPVDFYIDQDEKNTDAYIVYFVQSGLGLPDRDYYLKDDAHFAGLRATYQAYVAATLAVAGVADPEQRAADVMALETAFAKRFWTQAESRDRDRTYNKYPLAGLSEAFPGFDWQAYAKAAGIAGEADVVVAQPSAEAAIAEIFAATPIEAWRAYLAFHLVDDLAPYLSQDMVDRHFGFHGTALSGTPQIRPRWKRAVGLADQLIGEAIGKLYVERHFPPQAKVAMDQLVANVIDSYRVRIKGLDWMTPETKDQALAKLEKFTTKIGYPDQWRDYSALQFRADDLMGNVLRGRELEIRRHLAKLGQPVDRGEWYMTPQTVNAYYNPSANEIVFPAAILQAPFFDPDADMAVNYGAIGAVIGHEISHGFDDQGRKSDGDGNLRDWWTAADAEAFAAKAARLGAQYGQYEPVAGMKLNPELTMGENIGDLGGLAVAFHAYHQALGGQTAPVIAGFDGDQRFFMGWAQVWRRLYREDELRRRVITDPHSSSEFRANGIVRNMDAWAAAFDVKPDDKLYLAPEERVVIW